MGRRWQPKRVAALSALAAVLLVGGIDAQNPVIPPPQGVAQPTAPPAPAATAPPVAAPTAATASNGSTLTLYECRGALQRMNGLLLMEIIFEMLFKLARFTQAMEIWETELMKLAIIRAVWTFFPVVPLNISALWWGGGTGKGGCLGNFASIRIAFTLIVFYTMYSALDTVLLILQAKEEDEDSDYDSYYDESSRRDWRRRRRRSRGSTGTASADESSEPGFFGKVAELFGR